MIRPRFSRPSEETNWDRSDTLRCAPRVYPTKYAEKILFFKRLATKPRLQESNLDEYNSFSPDIL